MQERKHTTKYLLPVALAIILVISLGLGVRCLHSQLMKLTIEERSNQSEENKRHQSSRISGVKKRLIARLPGHIFELGIQFPSDAQKRHSKCVNSQIS